MPVKNDGSNRDIRNFFKAFSTANKPVPVTAPSASQGTVCAASPNQHSDGANIRDRPPLALPERRPTNNTLSRESSLSSIPLSSARTPKRTPQKQAIVPVLDGSADDELDHSSPTPLAQRRLSAAERSSPSQPSSPVPASRKPAAPPAPQATTSFSSISTLSSLTQGSQGSRRVIRNGWQAVTNSESGSADSDDDLADLDSFIPRKKMKMTPPGKDAAHAIEVPDTVKPDKKRQSGRLTEKHGFFKSGRNTLRLPPSPPKTTYKHSLERMVRERQKREKQDARIAEAEAAVADAEQVRAKQAAADQEMQSLDANALAEIAADDSDEGQRVLVAVRRTEALLNEEKFRFFHDKPAKARVSVFPARQLPNTQWAKILQDSQSRDQACLSGFVTDLAAFDKLNSSVIEWFAEQLVRGAREDLCEAYVDIIRTSAEHPEQVDSTRLSTLSSFYRTNISLGEAKDQAADDQPPESSQLSLPPEDEIACICGYDAEDDSIIACESCETWQHTTCYYPQYDGQLMPTDFAHRCVACKPQKVDTASAKKRQDQKQKERSSPTSDHQEGQVPGLQYVAQVLQHCAPPAGTEGIGRAFCDLALANIDDNIRQNTALRLVISDAIEHILANVTSLQDKEALYGHARTMLLVNDKITQKWQCRLITSLPSTSLQTHHLRRRLALYLITKYSKPRPLISGDWVATILKRLRTAPEYVITEGSDYSLLVDLVAVLDIAVDAGFSDFAFLDQPKSKNVSTEEKQFNALVDALAGHLRLMANRITGAGATHVVRVEAKSALERLVMRLECSVRTRPRGKKGVFDGEGRRFMEGFVTRIDENEIGKEEVAAVDAGAGAGKRSVDGHAVEDKKGEEKDEVEVIPLEMLSDREMSEQEEEGDGEVFEDAPPIAAPSSEGNEVWHSASSHGIAGGVDGAADHKLPKKAKRSTWDFANGEVRLR